MIQHLRYYGIRYKNIKLVGSGTRLKITIVAFSCETKRQAHASMLSVPPNNRAGIIKGEFGAHFPGDTITLRHFETHKI